MLPPSTRAWIALAGLSAACTSDLSGLGTGQPHDASMEPSSSPDAGLELPGLDASSEADAGTVPAPEGLPFPPDFVFGAAVAGFQVDMGCPTLPSSICDDTRSDWYDFTTAPGTVGSDDAHLSGQHPAQVGPGFWELYADDIRRADEELHHQALRFSIEWSRIFPEPTDGADTDEEVAALADPRAVAKYHAMLGELRARGMKPLVTLYHYSLPVWIHDAAGCHADFDGCSPKGWVDAERTLREIQKYTRFCAREFGAEVDWWATLNEPLQNMLFGYVQPTEQRAHPPAVSLETGAARIVFNALIDAHARMYDAIKEADRVDADGDGDASFVGVVYPLVPIVPNNPDSWGDLDDVAATNIDYLWNRVFLNAVALGAFDPALDRNIVQRKDLAGRMDYVGINYYFGIKVSGLGFSVPVINALSPLFTANPLSFEEIPNDPAALKDFVRWVNEDLGQPVIITENGVPDAADDGTTPTFLVKNLKAVQESIAEGADVRGYFYWTLMDNYEWNHGMEVRMGLYAVDKNDPSKKRVARRAVPIFGTIARHRVLPFSYLERYASD
jgi:beta-galactosidase